MFPKIETDNVNEDKTENSSKDKIVEVESEQKMEVASSDGVSDNAQAASSSTDLEVDIFHYSSYTALKICNFN